jgi:hypothetical protein
VSVEDRDRHPHIFEPAFNEVRDDGEDRAEERQLDRFRQSPEKLAEARETDHRALETGRIPTLKVRFEVSHPELVVGGQGVVVMASPHPSVRIEVGRAFAADPGGRMVALNTGPSAPASWSTHAVSSR